MKTFGGTVLFLDRGDINTDEIIPAKYLTEVSKEALKQFCLEDLKLAGFDPAQVTQKAAIVSRANFGCGSSREHAPWALEVNGIHMVIAESFARIFRQNMYNCGMIAVELPSATINQIFATFGNKLTQVQVDVEKGKLSFSAPGCTTLDAGFHLSDFEKALVTSGGWVDYAAKHY